MNRDWLSTEGLIIEHDNRNRGIYSRAVFSNEDGFYVKLWEKDYFYAEHFKHALSLGFYNDICPYVDFIHDDDYFPLGYITKEGKQVTYDNLNRDKLKQLADIVAKRCIEHDLIYIDFNIKNLIEINGQYMLIDLEPIIKVSEARSIQGLDETLSFNDLYYRSRIAGLLDAIGYNHKLKIVRHHTKSEKEIKYGTANGRVFLETEYLPTLSGKTFFVGVNYYTEFYHQLTKSPEEFETLDVIEGVAEHGSPYKHYVGNLLDFVESRKDQYKYNNVCFFGILGHPDDWDIIKQDEDIIKTIEILDSLVAENGTLLLGPATVTLTNEYWEKIFQSDILKKYDVIMNKKIDINYIWYARKRVGSN